MGVTVVRADTGFLVSDTVRLTLVVLRGVTVAVRLRTSRLDVLVVVVRDVFLTGVDCVVVFF